MRSTFVILFSASVWLFTGCATPKPAPPPSLTNIPAEIAHEIQLAAVGWNHGDFPAFLSMYADTATFALGDEVLTGRAAIREFYAPNFAPGAVRDELTFEKFDVELLAPDAALVRGIYLNRRLGELTRRGTTTLVMRRIAGQWRVIHDHTN